MDKDREELEKVLRENNIGYIVGRCGFIEALLRWKRGEKHWWRFCPECGAKRPE